MSAILGLTGCLEESTVVKFNKDGSGLIHVRKYENTLTTNASYIDWAGPPHL